MPLPPEAERRRLKEFLDVLPQAAEAFGRLRASVMVLWQARWGGRTSTKRSPGRKPARPRGVAVAIPPSVAGRAWAFPDVRGRRSGDAWRQNPSWDAA